MCIFITCGSDFWFNDTATTEIYTLSLHDALPISYAIRRPHCRQNGCARSTGRRHCGQVARGSVALGVGGACVCTPVQTAGGGDRKSTRLNSSHANISYAVFCLTQKIKNIQNIILY